jgi:hypothetical protein
MASERLRLARLAIMRRVWRIFEICSEAGPLEYGTLVMGLVMEKEEVGTEKKAEAPASSF